MWFIQSDIVKEGTTKEGEETVKIVLVRGSMCPLTRQFCCTKSQRNVSDVVPNFLNSGPGLNFLFVHANLFCTFKCSMICIISHLL